LAESVNALYKKEVIVPEGPSNDTAEVTLATAASAAGQTLAVIHRTALADMAAAVLGGSILAAWG
jgi:hypothetical protein